MPALTRRHLLCATGAGLGLAACGGGPDLPQVSGSGPGTALAALADVPVGGGFAVEVDGREVVLTQPVAGTVTAFVARCPHQGCSVSASGGELQCPCHGSRFDAMTGEVLEGPAEEPLETLEVAVVGGDVQLA